MDSGVPTPVPPTVVAGVPSPATTVPKPFVHFCPCGCGLWFALLHRAEGYPGMDRGFETWREAFDAALALTK